MRDKIEKWQESYHFVISLSLMDRVEKMDQYTED